MALPYFLTLILYLTCILSGYGQRKCLTDIIHLQNKANNYELYKSQEELKQKINAILEQPKVLGTAAESIYTIPVVVHVVYNDDPATNISDAQVLSQIDVLNEDFRKKPGTKGYNADPLAADTYIEFCLASRDPNGNFTTGIERIYNAQTVWTDAEEVTLKGLSHWPSSQYLNIYVVRMHDDYLGYTQYPSNYGLQGPQGDDQNLDGVVIDYKAFGRTGMAGASPRGLYNYGRTTTHEVGHWLGLLHIWGANAGCGDDYVSDTPIDEGPNLGSTCSDNSDCDGDGTSVPDLTNNYLDYSPDVCMNLFTIGQKDRMRAVLENSPTRAAILNSNGCISPLAISSKNYSRTTLFQQLLDSKENVQCELFDLTGKRIHSETLSGNDKSLPRFQVAAGLYLIKLSTGSLSATAKVWMEY